MIKGFTIPFVLCVGILIGSEYFLLEEVLSEKRLAIVIPSAVALISSIAVFWLFYKKYRKATK